MKEVMRHNTREAEEKKTDLKTETEQTEELRQVRERRERLKKR